METVLDRKVWDTTSSVKRGTAGIFPRSCPRSLAVKQSPCKRKSVGAHPTVGSNLYIICGGKMLGTKQKGDLTELQCITAFYELGYHVSVPYGENLRYDFIADINGELIKIQCKTCRAGDGVVKFAVRSTRSNSKATFYRSYTVNDIDYFATFYNDKCYLVPIEECAGMKLKILRFSPSKRNQIKNVNFAKDYELSVQIQKILDRQSCDS